MSPFDETRALLAISTLAALIYGAFFCWRGPSWAASLIKTTAIAALALIPYRLAGPDMLTAALALCALGDFALSRPGDRAFLIGMGGFAAGHLAYVALFLQGGADIATLTMPVRAGLAIGVLIVAAIMARKILPRAGALRLPVAAYIGVIGAMGLAALAIPGTSKFALAPIGALLFILSDAALGEQKFVKDQGVAGHLTVWVFYWLAQITFVFGLLLVHQV